MTAEKHRCAGRVYIDSYSQPTRRCQRPATVEEAGKWWCSSHAPSLRAARRTAKDAAYEATRQRAIASRRRQAAESTACRGISTEALEAGAIAELVAAAVKVGRLGDPGIGDVYAELREAAAKLEVKP